MRSVPIGYFIISTTTAMMMAMMMRMRMMMMPMTTTTTTTTTIVNCAMKHNQQISEALTSRTMMAIVFVFSFDLFSLLSDKNPFLFYSHNNNKRPIEDGIEIKTIMNWTVTVTVTVIVIGDQEMDGWQRHNLQMSMVHGSWFMV